MLDNHRSQLGLGHLGTNNLRAEAPLIIPKRSSPNMPNRELRLLEFGRGRSRGVWDPGDSSPMPGHGQYFGQGITEINGSASRGRGLRVKRISNKGRDNGRRTGQGQEPGPQNNRNGNNNGCGRDLLVMGSLLLGETPKQVSKVPHMVEEGICIMAHLHPCKEEAEPLFMPSPSSQCKLLEGVRLPLWHWNLPPGGFLGR